MIQYIDKKTQFTRRSPELRESRIMTKPTSGSVTHKETKCSSLWPVKTKLDEILNSEKKL